MPSDLNAVHILEHQVKTRNFEPPLPARILYEFGSFGWFSNAHSATNMMRQCVLPERVNHGISREAHAFNARFSKDERVSGVFFYTIVQS